MISGNPVMHVFNSTIFLLFPHCRYLLYGNTPADVRMEFALVHNIEMLIDCNNHFDLCHLSTGNILEKELKDYRYLNTSTMLLLYIDRKDGHREYPTNVDYHLER